MKNLLLSGGIYHPFEETSASIAGHLDSLGVTSVIHDVRSGLETLRTENFDLLTVNALSWSMTQAEKYEPFRDQYAFNPSDDDRRAIENHMDGGGGLLGLHTAAICFDGWAQWPRILGVGWVWGQSHHPAPCAVTVSDEAGEFEVWDELYCDMTVETGTEILATGRADGVDEAQPIYTRKDRSAYLALGHDLTSTANPGYRRLLLTAARSALGK